jgi:RNA polymerase sigma-70 factor (ECF subfamily)
VKSKEEFANALGEHLPFLNRLVRGLTRGDPAAEDIVQQTMLKALIHSDQFRFQSTLKTWLVSIARNETFQAYKRTQRARLVPLVPESLQGERLPALQHSDSGAETRERETAVRLAVARLPQTYRCVIELHDLEEVPLKEVAIRLRLTLAAVKSRHHRGKEQLRPLLQKRTAGQIRITGRLGHGARIHPPHAASSGATDAASSSDARRL